MLTAVTKTGSHRVRRSEGWLGVKPNLKSPTSSVSSGRALMGNKRSWAQMAIARNTLALDEE